MKALISLMAWLILLALCWPMVLDYILIATLFWIVALPLRVAWRTLHPTITIASIGYGRRPLTTPASK